jgi:hypothetical protein
VQSQKIDGLAGDQELSKTPFHFNRKKLGGGFGSMVCQCRSVSFRRQLPGQPQSSARIMSARPQSCCSLNMIAQLQGLGMGLQIELAAR